MLLLRARIDQGAVAMKGWSTFPKAPASLAPHYQIVPVVYRTLIAEKQSVYSTAPAKWVIKIMKMTVIPVVTGGLGTMSKGLESELEEWEIGKRLSRLCCDRPKY